MISIDQVLLLQQKVESAVQKIVELKSENDALRRQCSELTNALSEKTELLNSFTADEKKIEVSILGALDRLNKIENSVLSQAGQIATPSQEKAISPTSNQNTNKPETAETIIEETVETETADNKSEPSEPEIEISKVTPEVEESSEDVMAPEFDLDVNADSSDESNEKEEKFDIF